MSWPMVSLGDVCVLINGDRGKNYPSKEALFLEGIPFINASNLQDDLSIKCSGANYITDERFELLSNGKVENKDILFCLRGSLGKFGIVGDEIEKGAIASSLVIIRPKNKLNHDYLKNYLRSTLCKREIQNYENGAAQPNLSAKDLKEFKIPLPPLSEQQRIAAILDKADAIRQKRQQAIKLADDFLRSVFLDMFGDPVSNPKGWEIRFIDQLCTEIVDCINRTAPTVDNPTLYKMIRTTNVRNYSLDTENVRYVDEETYLKWVRRLEPKVGDLIFTREAPAGEAAVVYTNEKIFLGQRTMHFRPDPKLISSEYLLFELMGKGVKVQINKMHAGSTVTHLSVPECKKFKIRVPPLELQRKFESIRMFVLRSGALRAESDEIPLFESISQKAFSGQL
jgi:Restriction endonuclease S subunits